MDFTQIMQRYTRLREQYEQGEIDADSFEQQVNGMIFKDEQGRYWQIGVKTGLWYYYDGTKWVQDDLVDDSIPDEEPEEPVVEMAAIDELFPEEEAVPAEDPSPFDMAFEEQLASQFANSGNSQIFDVFEDTDIFASILKGKGIDPDEDPLAAPAEDVEGLAEHLETTQPVSIESLMGEGTAIQLESDQEELDFLFEENDESDDYPDIEDGSQMDLSAILGADDDLEEYSVPETDVRVVSEKEVVTGELHMPGEPLTRDALDKLMDSAESVQESSFSFGSSRRPAVPFQLPEDEDEDDERGAEEEQPALDWKLEPSEYPNKPLAETELPESPMLEILDDDFSLDDLVAESEQDYLEETQPVPTNAAVEFYEDIDDEEDDFFGSGDDAPFELPEQPDFQALNTAPNEVSPPVGETIQSSRPLRLRRKLPNWVVILGIFIGVFIVGLLIFGGWYILSNLGGVGEGPGWLPTAITTDDPNYILYEDFAEIKDDEWVGMNDTTIGVADAHQGFYFIYAIAPEMPTTAIAQIDLADVVVDVETTQLNDNFPDVYATYGVMCRVQENGDGYAFRITNNGLYVIEKYQNGIFIPLNDWAYSDVIKANKDLNKNHIVATCSGSQLTLSVNGHLLDVAVDSTFTSGKVGFIAQAGATGAITEVHYDELWLTRP